MIAVLTKWQKNAPDSIAWPNTLSFISSYSETNLPPGFTMTEYLAFMSYLASVSGSMPNVQMLSDLTLNDTDGNAINARIFVDENDYNTYKSISTSAEDARNNLLSLFKLTRTVKVLTNDQQVFSVLSNELTFSELDALIAS